MRLAWSSIVHDRVRFLVAVLGIACAVFLIMFQSSVLAGFLQAASKVIEASDGDLWIMARGVSCFEFPAPVERRFAEMARGVPGVAGVSRICTGVVQCRRPDGRHQLVTLAGAEPESGPRFPRPYLPGGSGATEPEGLLVDSSNAPLLAAGSLPMEVELNRQRARVIGKVEGFSTFLGSPYVFASYPDAARYTGLLPEEAVYIVVRLAPGYPPAEVQRRLRALLPAADVLTGREFALKSRLYWVTETGAGAAILMVALLGFAVGLAVVSQAIYATTMENIDEFATLKALGASRRYIVSVVLAQAIACGVLGYAAGLLAFAPAAAAARAAISWIRTPPWLPPAVFAPCMLMCALASVVSIHKALSVDPERVFRA